MRVAGRRNKVCTKFIQYRLSELKKVYEKHNYVCNGLRPQIKSHRPPPPPREKHKPKGALTFLVSKILEKMQGRNVFKKIFWWRKDFEIKNRLIFQKIGSEALCCKANKGRSNFLSSLNFGKNARGRYFFKNFLIKKKHQNQKSVDFNGM